LGGGFGKEGGGGGGGGKGGRGAVLPAGYRGAEPRLRVIAASRLRKLEY